MRRMKVITGSALAVAVRTLAGHRLVALLFFLVLLFRHAGAFIAAIAFVILDFNAS